MTPLPKKPPAVATFEGMAWSRLQDASAWLIANGDAQDNEDGRAVIALIDKSKKRRGA